MLGETNIAMHEKLDGLLRKEYETATKNLHSTVQQLTSSQQIIQVALGRLVLNSNQIIYLPEQKQKITRAGHKGCETTLICALKKREN